MMEGESEQTSVLDVYERHGAAWAELRNDHLIEGPWLDRFSDRLPPRATVLDIGCGSGVPIARELLRRGFDMTGVDGSATMLALFRSNLPGSPVHLADMRELDLGRRFAGLLAWDSLFHLSPDDQRAMFSRFGTHAAPGAALMFTSGDAEGSAIGELEGDPLYHGSLGPEEYRAFLDTEGFDLVDHAVRDPTCGFRTIWLAQRRGP
jgi:SAM-dependent methyltransferase